jgi:hypothetical protein
MNFLISYSPLANSQIGRGIAARNDIAPYVDASCRREPDFESDLPFVSGLCRPRFIARLEVGDVLVYVTKKSGVHSEGRRLVAVLKLQQAFSSHSAAAKWYLANGFRIPRSCIVPGNDPLPIHLANPKMGTASAAFTDSRVWDRAVYVPRAIDCKKCFSAQAHFLNLKAPPIVKDDFWTEWTAGEPGQRTQNGGLAIDEDLFAALLHHAGIRLNLLVGEGGYAGEGDAA